MERIPKQERLTTKEWLKDFGRRCLLGMAIDSYRLPDDPPTDQQIALDIRQIERFANGES
jgi:hypothetical protein